MSAHARDYHAVAARLSPSGCSRGERMQMLVDALWAELSKKGVSWLGFYLDQPEAPDDRRLLLGAHRDRPACSPIGLHGVCGEALVRRVVQIVDDVADLGPAYIACDPRDRSEIVVPLLERDGVCTAVLDLDSHDTASFDASDERGLQAVLRACGLTTTPDPA